ncbi:MAG TPA: ROK family protein [Diaminobutyricibacter sp.]
MTEPLGSRRIGPSSENTRSAILDMIRSGEVVSRIQLAEMSGLTGASITRIVKSLIADGLVLETGYGDSTGGKRPTLLELNRHARYAVGLSLDDTRLTYVVTDLAGATVGRLVSHGIERTPPHDVIDRVVLELDDLLGELEIDRSDVVGIGVAGAGLDIHNRAERASFNAAEWEAFPVRESLEAATGMPVVRENDAACAALGQFWAGRIAATQDFATVYMATGFGCGIMVQGALARGASSNVGEIGHMVLQSDGPPCWCGSRGCLEMLAAPRSIVQRAFATAGLGADLGLSGIDDRVRQDFAVIARAAVNGDARCVALIEESANYLALALLSLVNVLDLDRIYLAGPGFSDAGAIYLRIVRDVVTRLARTRHVHGIEVLLSDPVLDPAAVGAATLALQQALTPHVRPNRTTVSA